MDTHDEDTTTSAQSAEPDDLEVVRIARERRLRRGLRAAARRALILARRYRFEEGPRCERELACVNQAMAWRAAARDLRGKSLAELDRPGLARVAKAASTEPASRRAG